ncbi:hypothetical protein SCP_0106560 [Sparassis crispa]|uniref:Rrp15p-domain-containing protein n=1 Tax=Sparassis crispa TaxID=139825 RepID=A0A401G6J6_9APHY|nr:hypothetical protein SCP_0106560 [Sparassis crispa]GBE77774.1 hypothetical protein SCP_0106560 [Sparassis crispa]
MSLSKRQKLAPREDGLDDETNSLHSVDEDPSGSGSSSGSDALSSPDAEDEISEVKRAKSKKTLKRKRRATDATHFGATLQSLLNTKAPSALPLSLKPSVARKRNDEKLEVKGKRILQVEKKEKEDKGRVKDVIGGWGGESERALRKVAQRGVVKLFNVIQQSQAANATAAEELKTHRGSGKPTLPAPKIESKAKGEKTRKHDSSHKSESKGQALAGEDFFDIIRSGGVVSKA